MVFAGRLARRLGGRLGGRLAWRLETWLAWAKFVQLWEPVGIQLPMLERLLTVSFNTDYS